MKVIRVFPRQTSFTPRDDMAFVGEPPMIRPEADVVHVSCTFTWDIPMAKHLADAWSQYYQIVSLGGPAFGSAVNGFVPGQYIKQGVTFTSRGCNNQCPWCLVPPREGRLHEYADFAEGNIVNDNNFLQCSRQHQERVFEMLKTQREIQFSGGLDARLLKDWQAEAIRELRIDQVFLACDTDGGLKPLIKAVKLLGLPQGKVRCYMLCAFGGQTIQQAEERLKSVYHAGCLPFAQLYQPPDKWIDYPPEWRHLARTWSRPAAMKTLMKVF